MEAGTQNFLRHCLGVPRGLQVESGGPWVDGFFMEGPVNRAHPTVGFSSIKSTGVNRARCLLHAFVTSGNVGPALADAYGRWVFIYLSPRVYLSPRGVRFIAAALVFTGTFVVLVQEESRETFNM